MRRVPEVDVSKHSGPVAFVCGYSGAEIIVDRYGNNETHVTYRTRAIKTEDMIRAPSGGGEPRRVGDQSPAGRITAIYVPV